MSNLVKCVLCAVVLLSACSSHSSPLDPPSAQSTLTQSPSTGVDADLRAFDVVQQIRVAMPNGEEQDAWIVRKGKPTQGVVVDMGGRLVTLHDPLPQTGILVGPWPGEVRVETMDLDHDGIREIMIRGKASNGPGIWVYRYEVDPPRFVHQGDIGGDGLKEVKDADGAMRFEVITLQRSKQRQSSSTFWRWKPGGFYEVK